MKVIGFVLLGVVLLAGFLWFCHRQNNHLVVTHFDVPAPVREPVRILHLSDLHSKQFGWENKKLLEKMKTQLCDFIVITGDLINDRGKDVPQVLDFLRELCGWRTVVYIPGNHEGRLSYKNELMERIRTAGAIVLRNEIATLVVRGQPLHLLGLEEKQGGFQDYKEQIKGGFVYENHDAEFETLCAHSGTRIVLSHFPENFACIGEHSYQNYDFDLQLSGHAHGGQFILPFLGSVFAPGQGLFPKYANGMYGARPRLIVSRGLGNSEFPLRLFNYPQIVQITLTPEEKETTQ